MRHHQKSHFRTKKLEWDRRFNTALDSEPEILWASDKSVCSRSTILYELWVCLLRKKMLFKSHRKIGVVFGPANIIPCRSRRTTFSRYITRSQYRKSTSLWFVHYSRVFWTKTDYIFIALTDICMRSCSIHKLIFTFFQPPPAIRSTRVLTNLFGVL